MGHTSRNMALAGWLGRAPLARALASLLAAIVLTLTFGQPPAPRVTTPTAGPISLERARADVRVLTREAGHTGSPGNAQRRRYILEQLERAGVTGEVQSTDAAVSLLGRVVAARVHNVVARLPGRERGPAVLLSAHYDAVPNSPGAGDDAAGVATLLETARVLRASAPLRRDVLFLFTDGEELGLLGAEAFVGQHPLAREVGWVLNFEARGSRGVSAMYETSLPNAELLGIFSRVAPRPVASSLIASLSRVLPNDTDFTVYRRAGMAGYAFAFADGFEDYHRATDTVHRLDARSLSHHLSYAVPLARELAEHPPARGSAAPRQQDVVYFDVLGRAVVSYPLWLALASGGLAFAAWLLVVVYGRRAGLASWSGVAWGLLGVAGSLIGPMVAVSLLEWLLARGLGLPLRQRIEWASGLLVAHVSLGLAVCFEVYRRLLRRASAAELELGSWGAGALLALLLAAAVPGASYAPALSTLPGIAGWWWRRGPSSRSAASAVWGSALGLLPAVFFGVSVGFAFFVLVGTQLPAVTLLAVGWGAALLLPWSAELWQARSRVAQLSLALLALLVSGSAVVLGRTRPSAPTFTDLYYAFDVATKGARYSATTGLSHPALRQFLLEQAAPPSPLPPSELTLEGRVALASGRYRQTLLLRPATGARCVTLTQIAGARVLELSINGQAPRPNVRFSPELDKKLWTLVTGQRPLDAFNFGYCGGRGEPVRLELLTAGRTLFFEISDTHDGLPAGALDLEQLAPKLHFDLNGNRTLIGHRVQL